MKTVSDLLMPFFDRPGLDKRFARRMAGCAVDAYGPETRADHINIARTIAFSMASVALLAKATAAQDMPLKDQLRVLSRAGALNRSAHQSEHAMMQRRRYDKANPPAERPNLWANATPEADRAPPAPAEDPNLQARINEMLTVYHEALASEDSISESAPDTNPQPPCVDQPAAPPRTPFIHHTAPTAKTETASLRQILRRSVSMPPINKPAQATNTA